MTMNPLKPIKTALSAAAVIFAFVLLSSFETRAANWIEIDPSGFWYNSDSIYVDWETGFVAVETAETNNDGAFSYFLIEIDCDSWVIYGLGPLGENGNYNILPNWRTDPTLRRAIKQGSVFNRLAMQVC